MGAWLPCGFKGLVEKLSVKLVVPKERRGRVGVSTVSRCIHLTRSHDDNATLSAGLGKTVGIIVKFDRAIRLNTNTRPTHAITFSGSVSVSPRPSVCGASPSLALPSRGRECLLPLPWRERAGVRGDFKVRHYPFSQMTLSALQPGSGRPPIPHRWTASTFGPGPQFRMYVLKVL